MSNVPRFFVRFNTGVFSFLRIFEGLQSAVVAEMKFWNEETHDIFSQEIASTSAEIYWRANNPFGIRLLLLQRKSWIFIYIFKT